MILDLDHEQGGFYLLSRRADRNSKELTSVRMLLDRSSSTRFVRPRKALGSTDPRLHLAHATLCRLIRPRREKWARPNVGMSFPETLRTCVLRSTVVGIDANVWLEQSTVIFESLQMHWHFLGHVFAASPPAHLQTEL